MKELEEKFTGRGEVRGFIFTQINKNDKGYIYKVKPPDSDHYYEVFKRKINLQYDNVTYPSSKQFGISAWSYYDFNKALDKFNHFK